MVVAACSLIVSRIRRADFGKTILWPQSAVLKQKSLAGVFTSCLGTCPSHWLRVRGHHNLCPCKKMVDWETRKTVLAGSWSLAGVRDQGMASTMNSSCANSRFYGPCFPPMCLLWCLIKLLCPRHKMSLWEGHSCVSLSCSSSPFPPTHG